MKKYFFISILMLFGLQLYAQVFIPFAMQKGLLAPALTPSPVYVTAGNNISIIASGGMGVYSFSNTAAAQLDGAIITNLDNLDPIGDYFARATAYTTDTVTLTTPGYANVNATVATYNPIAISPTTRTLGWSGTQTFTATGGCLNGVNCVGGAYVFSIFSGGGTINAATGAYTAPNADGTTLVRVTDSIGNISTATVTVTNNLTINPTSLRLAVFSTSIFTAALGMTPYTYSIFAGGGTINSGTGLYTAPAAIGAATVRVTDALLGTSNSAVTIIEPVDVQVGLHFACALYNNGDVKCWGQNASGQLGLGNTTSVGDVAAEVGGANLFVDLGTGRTATQIAVGGTHICALLDNSTVKCWGNGTNGRLGTGATASKGDGPSEMGDSLLAISLGTGLTPAQVYAFNSSTCVRFTTNQIKCFGNGASGRLGTGAIASIGDGAGEMGDSLAFLDLGTGRTATKITGGLDFKCALLDNFTVKCWGNNNRGQLGKDSTTVLGDGVNEMGNNLTEINIGVGRTALDISTGYETTCVRRDNNTAICWGRNNFGQVGKGSTGGGDASIGDQAGEMAAIANINFAAGFGTLAEIFSFGRSFCARDSLNVMKCWGRNTEGQALLGNTTTQTAPNATASSFGTGLVVSKIKSEFYTGCALFTNKRIKCWGRATDSGAAAASGVLLNNGGTANIGDAGGEIGDSLGYANH